MLLFIHIRLNIAILKKYKKLFRYNIIYFMCYGNILPISHQNDNDDYCTFTDLVERKN